MRFRGTFCPETWLGIAVWLAGCAVLMTVVSLLSSPWWLCLLAGIAWSWVIQAYEDSSKTADKAAEERR